MSRGQDYTHAAKMTNGEFRRWVERERLRPSSINRVAKSRGRYVQTDGSLGPVMEIDAVRLVPRQLFELDRPSPLDSLFFDRERFLASLKRYLALGLLVIVFAASFLLSDSASAINRETHCHADGYPCVISCDPLGGFIAVTEDDPCWLIQSNNSAYTISISAKLFGAKDYRS